MRLQSALTVAAAVLLLAGTAFAADQVEWRVVYVADGDTITCLDEGNKQHRIRIDGIDAPERGQPFGTVARDRMIALTKGKTGSARKTLGREQWSDDWPYCRPLRRRPLRICCRGKITVPSSRIANLNPTKLF